MMMLADKETLAIRHIHATLKARGYKRKTDETVHAWVGSEKILGKTVDLAIIVTDPLFADLPIIVLINPTTEIRAHVLSSGSICYAADASLVLDPDNPGGSVLRCIEQAKETLELADNISSNAEIRAEFGAYWAGRTVFIEFESKKNSATHYIVDCNNGKTVSLISSDISTAHFLASRHKSVVQQLGKVSILHMDQDLDVGGVSFPPQNLQELTDWIHAAAPNYLNTLQNLLLPDAGPKETYIVARNITLGVLVELPNDIKQSRKKGFRNDFWKRATKKRPGDFKIQRYTGLRVDEEYRFTRNLDDSDQERSPPRSLENKKIALIGIGSIGGYLAQALTRSGAGAGKSGELALFDPDVLFPANLGRHLLSFEDLARPKAEQVANRLSVEAPRLNVISHVINALTRIDSLRHFDLVIDATGEERVSLALNSYKQNRRSSDKPLPPILHCWLIGNGASSQTFFNGMDSKACFRCLRPDLAKQARYWPLKDGAEQILKLPQDGCGGAFVAYSVSAPMIAAGLALEAVLDWARGSPHPALRTLNIDPTRTQPKKHVSPERHPNCPACKGL